MHKAIQAKNDGFRKAVFLAPQPDGKAVMTPGIANLGSMAQALIYREVATFNAFTEANDPYGEHDFGGITLDNLPKVFWKIDYYADETLQHGAEDRLNCYRVLVIMLAEEY